MNTDFLKNLSRVIDISCVKPEHTLSDIDRMADEAIKHRFVCAFALPSLTPHLIARLKGEADISVGGTVGFPSGCDTTESKVFQAKELLRMGCGELDMVVNIAGVKSRRYGDVSRDIRAVVDAAGGVPVKVILEVALLTDAEIVRAAEVAADAGAAFVKTGTGWCSKPTEVRHIRLIRQAVQERAKIKAAGGIRDLNTMLEMAKAGCDRFGIGLDSALKILRQAGQIL
ncbi:MAG TPA: deoxyribose-phosphate aldolase [Caproiciproducens sp.]|nr:deoxyribose-phosphate aldolase [Caproiciproducens sp.]